MKNRVKKIVLFGFALFLLFQLYQPNRNNELGFDLAYNFKNKYDVPKNIDTMLQVSCYDCHSNNTNYPWYSRIQPIASFMASHIEEGKKELNFSEFGSYSKRKQQSKLEAINNVLKDNTMPLGSYTIIHNNAKLSKEQKLEIQNWIKTKLEDETLY